MNQYLKSYQVTLRTVGPVFVGSGREIGKKEYVFLNQGKVGIPDIQKLYGELARRRLAADFEKYLLGNGREDLTYWLRTQKIRMEEMKPFIKYALDCGDAVLERGAGRLQILECVKDAYGMPYLPGSSLKGMLRTVLLGADVLCRKEHYRREKQSLERSVDQFAPRMAYLKRECAGLEHAAYRILNRPSTRPDDAVNDALQGLALSDSEPLSVEDLTLCQKIDVHTDGEEKRLPILRECVKPNTEIRFTITVDTNVCGFTGEQILRAARKFMDCYHEDFASAFGLTELKGDYVFCGGGCGFVSKTVVYPLFGKEDGIAFTQKVFEKTKVPSVHGHNKDREHGASPHTLKCTKYRGKTLQMGLCSIEALELLP